MKKKKILRLYKEMCVEYIEEYTQTHIVESVKKVFKSDVCICKHLN